MQKVFVIIRCHSTRRPIAKSLCRTKNNAFLHKFAELLSTKHSSPDLAFTTNAVFQLQNKCRTTICHRLFFYINTYILGMDCTPKDIKQSDILVNMYSVKHQTLPENGKYEKRTKRIQKKEMFRFDCMFFWITSATKRECDERRQLGRLAHLDFFSSLQQMGQNTFTFPNANT